uniref:RNase H type-1 domain-containing protein n=1 Tax=Solanum lycopersicum TaxID=4081 RepID=A0A3Q7EV87_SOLLC
MTSKSVALVRWIKPPLLFVKLHSDGRFRDGIFRGCGVVRDSMGALIIAYSIPLSARTNNWAEAKAMLFGLKWCIARRYRLVIGETYSLLLSSCTSRMCPMLLKAWLSLIHHSW